MAEVRRTVVVKLEMDDSDATLLHETVEEYLRACNYVVQDAWKDDYKPTSKTNLHDRTKSPHGGATRHLALKSGTLNVNGGYSPATREGWPERESTDKPTPLGVGW